MDDFTVWQKATVWYKTRVTADNPEQAVKLSQDDPENTGWDIDLETAVMSDEYEVYDDDGSLVMELDNTDGLV
jgi:hypothetical protein